MPQCGLTVDGQSTRSQAYTNPPNSRYWWKGDGPLSLKSRIISELNTPAVWTTSRVGISPSIVRANLDGSLRRNYFRLAAHCRKCATLQLAERPWEHTCHSPLLRKRHKMVSFPSCGRLFTTHGAFHALIPTLLCPSLGIELRSAARTSLYLSVRGLLFASAALGVKIFPRLARSIRSTCFVSLIQKPSTLIQIKYLREGFGYQDILLSIS